MDVTARDRERFLAEQRAISRRRYDDLHSQHYDEMWGDVTPLHADFIRRLAAALPRPGQVLDAACGTGKYWPAMIAAGLQVLGVDQSEGMLGRARSKHPEVPARVLALQDLADAADLRTRFDAVLCVDAMEFVGPEDWPRVLAGFAAVLRGPGVLYLTVEQADSELDPDDVVDARQVAGESIEGGGYHYYPSADQVRSWLADAGFAVTAEAEGEWYWHLLASRPAAAG
jgi:SAM-dependent methyltransferase